MIWSCYRMVWAGIALVVLAAGCDVGDGWIASMVQRVRAGRCPIVPMRLVLEVKGERPRIVLNLDAKGSLEVALSQGEVARLDPWGCLCGPDGVWVEETLQGNLWTLRGITTVDDGGLRLGERVLRIRDDGTVVDDPPSKPVVGVGVFRFEGYRPEAQCAARILLQAWLSMMPSMAVVDGHPVEIPLPEDSVCRERCASFTIHAATIPAAEPRAALRPTGGFHRAATVREGPEEGLSESPPLRHLFLER